MISLQNRNPIKKDKTMSIFSSFDDNGDPLNFLEKVYLNCSPSDYSLNSLASTESNESIGSQKRGSKIGDFLKNEFSRPFSLDGEIKNERKKIEFNYELFSQSNFPVFRMSSRNSFNSNNKYNNKNPFENKFIAKNLVTSKSLPNNIRTDSRFVS